MRFIILACLALFLLPAGCEPEFQEKNFEGGWMRYAVGLCERIEGKEPQRACAEANVCTYYCCECESGTQYSAAVCYTNDGCGDSSSACRESEAEACK